jgi:GT2 family glycosyltransferase
MTSTTLFSVVIPTYHRNDLLAKCLDCLKPGVQTLAADQYEVIVTDDGRTTTAEHLIQEQYPWVTWVAGPQKGPAANRNNGAKVAQGEWLVFTDDDCLPDTQWLEAYSKATTGTALALEGAIHPLGDPNQDLAECPINLAGGCFWSANIAVQRELFEKVGGFDPTYPLAAHEDQDLKLRLESFTEIDFVIAAKVLHPVRIPSLKESFARIPKRCDAWVFHTLKNRKELGHSGKVSIFLFGYKFQLAVLIRSFLKHHFKESCVALAMLIFGLPLIAKRLVTTNEEYAQEN